MNIFDNIDIFEIIILGVLLVGIFAKRLDESVRKMMIYGAGAALALVMFTGGGTSNPTPVGATIFGMDMTTLLVVVGAAFLIFRKHQSDGTPVVKQTWLMAGVAAYLLFAAFKTPSVTF